MGLEGKEGGVPEKAAPWGARGEAGPPPHLCTQGAVAGTIWQGPSAVGITSPSDHRRDTTGLRRGGNMIHARSD